MLLLQPLEYLHTNNNSTTTYLKHKLSKQQFYTKSLFECYYRCYKQHSRRVKGHCLCDLERYSCHWHGVQRRKVVGQKLIVGTNGNHARIVGAILQLRDIYLPMAAQTQFMQGFPKT